MESGTNMAIAFCKLGILALGIGTFSQGGASEGVFRKLSDAQITEAFTGMEFTDEVHWREMYEADGTLRNFEMGRYRKGRWRTLDGRLCLRLGEDPAETCRDVWIAGKRIKIGRGASDGAAFEGVLQRPTDGRRPADSFEGISFPRLP